MRTSSGFVRVVSMLRRPALAAASALCVAASASGFALAATAPKAKPSGPHVAEAKSTVGRLVHARRVKGAGTPSASAALVSCVSAPLAANRLMKVRAVMVGTPGAVTMAMRFHLGETLASRSELEKTGTGLGVWETLGSARSTTRWTKDKTIAGLAPSAYYRVWIDFRWLNSAGREVAHRSISANRCGQVDVRPDLSITESAAVKVAAAKSNRPGKFDYAVTVSNKGKGTSPASKVRVIVVGQTPVDAVLPAIERGHSRTVNVLDAPGCSAGPVIVEVDPEARTGDASTANNVATVPCT